MRNPHAPRMQDPIWPFIIIALDAFMVALFVIFMFVLAIAISF